MKAQASNPQRALCSALHSPMKRQFVKLCDRVIRWNSPPPSRYTHHPYPRLDCCLANWSRCVCVCVCVCVCGKEGQGGFGIESVSIGILAWQTGTHTLIHIITNTLSFWLSSPPICTQTQCNEGQPWSQLIKEANPQTLNELLFFPLLLSPLKMCKMHREREYKKSNWKA